MQQLSPRLRERAIGRLADEVVREVVAVAADRPHEPAPLQFAKSREQLGSVETRSTREIVRREGAAVGRRPDQRLARLFRQAARVGRRSGLSIGPAPARRRRGGAHGRVPDVNSGLPSLSAKIWRAVQCGIDQADELRVSSWPSGLSSISLKPPLAGQRAQYARRGRIVLDLSRARRADDQQAGSCIDMARDVMEERGGAPHRSIGCRRG